MSIQTRCPHCGSTKAAPRGSNNRPDRYQCKSCLKHYTERGFPKVLVFDIETLPDIGTFWSTGKQYIGYQNILEDFVILSWTAKWLMDIEDMGDILKPEECRERINQLFVPIDQKTHNADLRILKSIWKLLDKADAVITQNGVRFDVKKLNTRFAYYNMPPPAPFHNIDTLQAAQASFSSSSNRLDYMTQFLKVGRKKETDYELWKRCQVGDKESLSYMLDYNKNDIYILEDYYLRIRPWIPKHPNFSVYTDRYVELGPTDVLCPICRSTITSEDFIRDYRTPVGNSYKQFRCSCCGSIGRRNKKYNSKNTIQVRSVI
jgi:RNase H-like protein